MPMSFSWSIFFSHWSTDYILWAVYFPPTRFYPLWRTKICDHLSVHPHEVLSKCLLSTWGVNAESQEEMCEVGCQGGSTAWANHLKLPAVPLTFSPGSSHPTLCGACWLSLRCLGFPWVLLCAAASSPSLPLFLQKTIHSPLPPKHSIFSHTPPKKTRMEGSPRWTKITGSGFVPVLDRICSYKICMTRMASDFRWYWTINNLGAFLGQCRDYCQNCLFHPHLILK